MKMFLRNKGWQIKINDRNTNVKPDATRNTQFKRTYSRASALAPTTVDFHYVGNTNSLTGLLKSTNIDVRNPQALEHVTSLRQYAAHRSFNADEVFMYPVSKEKFDAVGLDRPAFGESGSIPCKIRLLDKKIEKVKYLRNDPGSRYPKSFGEKNFQELRPIINKQTNVPTLLWSTSLRGEGFKRHTSAKSRNNSCTQLVKK